MVAALGAKAGHHQVTDAAETPESSGMPSHGHTQSRHLGKRSGHKPCTGILPEAHPVRDAGGDGKDILKRPA